jgi:hypothetical protein
MRAWYRHVIGVTLCSVAFAACSADGITETTGDLLSDQEVLEVFAALSTLGSDILPVAAVAAPVDGPQLAPVPVDESFSESAACPNGGTVSISGKVKGTVDNETFDADLDFDLTEDFSSCATTTVSQLLVTFDGQPDIDITGNMTLSGQNVSGALSYQGGFAWATDDGRSGVCGVDFDVSFSTGTQSGSWSGQVCNRTVSLDS